MDKLTMAHDYFLRIISNPSVTLRAEDLHSIQYNAWVYADAMQAEADKREPSGLPEALKEEWQPDWNQAPEWANWWAMDADSDCYWFENKPTMLSVTWIPNHPTQINETQPFGFTGNWQESLRKRPQ